MKNRNNGKEIKIKDIDCEEAIKRLMDYIDDYLKTNRKTELEKHLASCRSCMDRYEFQKRIKTKISSLVNTSDSAISGNLRRLLDSL